MALDPNIHAFLEKQGWLWPNGAIKIDATGAQLVDLLRKFTAYLQHAGEGEAEPVAWMYTSKYDGRVEFFPNNALWKEHGYAERHPDAIPLFAAPHPHQAPEPVRLTDLDPTAGDEER